MHHRCHICMVYPLCGYGHVSSDCNFVRIVHHRCHICTVYPLCGYGHVTSNDHFVRIVHHRYHICMVYPLCGYRHVSSNYHLVRIVHHRYHICMVCPPVWIRTWDFKLPLCENCAPQVSHLYGFSPVWMQTCSINALLRKRCLPQVSHFNSFSTVQVFAFTAILNIPVSNHHTFRFVPQRGCTFVSSKFFCVQCCVTTETATLHDSIILSDMCKPPASYLTFLSNVSVKTQSTTSPCCETFQRVSHTTIKRTLIRMSCRCINTSR